MKCCGVLSAARRRAMRSTYRFHAGITHLRVQCRAPPQVGEFYLGRGMYVLGARMGCVRRFCVCPSLWARSRHSNCPPHPPSGMAADVFRAHGHNASRSKTNLADQHGDGVDDLLRTDDWRCAGWTNVWVQHHVCRDITRGRVGSARRTDGWRLHRHQLARRGQ